MMKTKKLLFSMIAVLVVIVFACEKAEDATEVVSTKSVQDEAISDILWNTIDADVDYATDLMESKDYKSVTDTCPMIIVDHPDSAFFPRTVTIDFGDSGCETWLGRIKRGKIVIEVSAPIYLTGSVRTVSLVDYYVNDYHIEGTQTLTNKGINDSGHMNWDVELVDGKITFPEGGFTSRQMLHNREWVNGFETPRYWWDDEWLIRGTASGVGRDQVTFSYTINTPVLVKAVCHFPVSGTVDMTIGDIGTMVLDYGDGDCDNLATITFGDRVWEITLH